MSIRNWRQLLGGFGLDAHLALHSAHRWASAVVLGVGIGVASGIGVPIAAAAGSETAQAEKNVTPEPFQVAQADTPPSEPATAPPEDENIDEIVVLGTETESAEDYAAGDSVTGFGAEDLAALGAASIADLASFTPNLEIVTSGATTPTFFIRGVGLNDFNANSTGAVSIYVDDVAINAPALQLGSLFDMDAVNVLRGPQGTGLARNSSAGAIKLYSKKPTGEFGGYLRAELGNFNSQDYEGAIEAPILHDLLSARVAFRLIQRDGTTQNRCGSAVPRDQRPVRPPPAVLRVRPDTPPFSICGEQVPRNATDGALIGTSPIPAGLPDEVNDRDNWAARGTLLFEPTLDQSWLLSGHGSRRDEITRLGQSFGTSGFFCLYNDTADCNDEVGMGGSRVLGLLGGRQDSLYIPPEVRFMLTNRAPCYQLGYVIPEGCLSPENFAALDLANQQVADTLARNLDYRPWEGDYNYVGGTTNDTWGTYLKGELALPWNLEFTTVTGYDGYNRAIGIDLDFSPETLFHIFTKDRGWQVTQDVQLAGETELIEGSPILWDIGGFMLRENLHVDVVNDFGPLSAFGVGEREYSQDQWSAGIYGHASFDFWDDFTLDGGARWNYEDKSIDYLLSEQRGTILTPLEERNIWRAWTGTVRLTYRFREDTHVSWKYTRGWKPGHYNATGSRLNGVTTADPETIDAFEASLGGSWFDRRLNFDLSFFYYNYKDYQIFTAQQFAGTGPEFVVLNANDAEVYGAELEMLARPWPGAFLTVRPSWLESQFLDFVLIQQANVSRNGINVTINRELQNSGNPLLNSPQFKVSMSFEQTIPLGPGARYGSLVPRYDGVWTDDTYYDATKGRGIPNIQGLQYLPSNTIGQRAYWLHNLRVAYRPPGGQIEIAGWVRNITNQEYKQFAFDGSTFQNTTIYFVGDPRTYGATVQVNF